MLAQPILPPPGWNLILRPERSNLEVRTTWWRANICHFQISIEKDKKNQDKSTADLIKLSNCPPLAKPNSNLEPVTGSKQKHMAISSLVGSAHSLKYPLKQGLLSKEQLN